MIVADTNVWIAYWTGEDAEDTRVFESALEHRALRMAPMVLSELLSDPALGRRERVAAMGVPSVDLAPGYWIRVGNLRSVLFAKKFSPKIVDTMIAQICIDHDAVLLTRDTGFKRFAAAGLRLQG